MPKTTAKRSTAAPPKAEPATSSAPTKQLEPKSTAIVKTHHGCLNRDLVEAKAYELWQARGGNALANWLEAESIVNDKQAAPIR